MSTWFLDNVVMIYVKCPIDFLIYVKCPAFLFEAALFLLILLLIYLVPTPDISVTALNTQTVGQSLTLQCEVTAVRGITSRVDIVWSSGGMELERMNNVSSTTMKNSLVYTSNYTILQVNTTDEGRVIQCEVVINTTPLVMTTDSIMLDVTGEYFIDI